MIKISDFKNMGFNITWKLIDIGFRMDTVFYDILMPEDILEYAISIMNKKNIPLEVTELACEYKEDVDKINYYINILSSKEDSDYNIEIRKWKVVYVSKKLTTPNTDYIKGLIELGDIWVKFGFPSDSPHIFQGKGNTITPEQYYTKENYKILFNKHKEWVKQEIALIQENDRSQKKE